MSQKNNIPIMTRMIPHRDRKSCVSVLAGWAKRYAIAYRKKPKKIIMLNKLAYFLGFTPILLSGIIEIIWPIFHCGGENAGRQRKDIHLIPPLFSLSFSASHSRDIGQTSRSSPGTFACLHLLGQFRHLGKTPCRLKLSSFSQKSSSCNVAVNIIMAISPLPST